MTVETFKKLVDGGYVTSVGHASFYTNNPDKLVGKSLEDLANEGAVSKMCADFVVEDTDVLNEIVNEVLEPVVVKDENTINVQTTTQNNESEIVVDDENPTTDDESTETLAENAKDEEVENVKDEDEVETDE